MKKLGCTEYGEHGQEMCMHLQSYFMFKTHLHIGILPCCENRRELSTQEMTKSLWTDCVYLFIVKELFSTQLITPEYEMKDG